MITDDLHSLTGVYALDALDADEAAAFEAHLPTCAACRREVRDLQEVAGALALVTLSAPPADVRDRIFAAIREQPSDEEGRPQTTAPDTHVVRTKAASAAAPPRSGPPRLLRAAVLIAAAAVVIVVLAGIAVTRLAPPSAAGGAIADEVAATAAVVDGPDTETILLDGPEGARGRVLWSPSAARGVLTHEGLPAPGPGQAFELWYIDSAPRPGPTFAADTSAVAIVGQGARAPLTFAVTIEPAGGVDAPTGPVVLAGGARR